MAAIIPVSSRRTGRRDRSKDGLKRDNSRRELSRRRLWCNSGRSACHRGTLAPDAGNSPHDPGTPAVVLDDQEVSAILGKGVRSNAGEDMGRIVDVIVSRDGQIHATIIDFGGFLGIGIRKIAVD
jgi:PRC-barrel domain